MITSIFRVVASGELEPYKTGNGNQSQKHQLRLQFHGGWNGSDNQAQRVSNSIVGMEKTRACEPLREHFGIPIIISSGYRCPALNRAVGGVPNSQHLIGEAADIVLPKLANVFYWLIDNVPFDQLGFESRGTTKWIHVSCKLDQSQNRQCIFRKTV